MEKRKTIIKIIILSIIAIIVVIISASYLTNLEFRTKVDVFLGKEVSENNLNSIEINSEDNPIVYAYDEYIEVLSKGVLKSYNKNAEVVASHDISMASPMMSSNGKYLLVA